MSNEKACVMLMSLKVRRKKKDLHIFSKRGPLPRMRLTSISVGRFGSSPTQWPPSLGLNVVKVVTYRLIMQCGEL